MDKQNKYQQEITVCIERNFKQYFEGNRLD